jgi:cell division protein FtsZ
MGHHVAVNTDAQHLLGTKAHRKVLIGRQTTGGRGTNMDMALGEAACHESRDQLESVIRETDIVVVLAGLGGGTGSGAAPMVADMARRRGSLAISLSTLPFSVEGSTRRDNAAVSQGSLSRSTDLSLVVPNDDLLETGPCLGLLEAFTLADEALLEPVRLLRRLLTRDDMPWVTTALNGAGAAHMGRGESDARRGFGKALDDAMASLFPPVDVGTCGRALVMFHAGPDGPDDHQLLELVRSVHLSMERNGRTLWGVHRDEAMEGRLRSVVMLAPSPKR